MKPYSAFLLASAAAVWAPLVLAKFAEYDLNYGFLMIALLISALAVLVILLVWFVRRSIVRDYMFSTGAFLATSSPVSICSFIWLYEEFVGQFLKL
jgi:hypothetical protein